MKNEELKLEDGQYKLEEGLYLNKKGKKYGLTYPPKKDKTKPFTKDNINWKNLLVGKSWLDLLIIALILFSAWSYARDTSECRAILSNPSKICGYQFNAGNTDVINVTLFDNTRGAFLNRTNWVYVK